MGIPQDQNSEEWKAWRQKHIGASEIPIIIGKSKWCTPYVLWQRKLGFVDDQKDNWAMSRGRELEPIAREMANFELKARFEPEVLVHKDLEWASASLDGLDRKKRAILEIKVPGLGDHQTAEKGEVPEHYIPQVQWQLFVSDLKTCYYASYYDGVLAVVKVKRDDDYIANELLPVAAEFYRCLVEMEEPSKGEDDFIQITDPEFEQYAREWKAAHETAAMFAEKEKYYKNKLISFTDDSNCQGYGVRLKRVARDGSVDWKALWKDLSEHFPDAAAQYSPDAYRSEQIGYWKVTEDKK